MCNRFIEEPQHRQRRFAYKIKAASRLGRRLVTVGASFARASQTLLECGRRRVTQTIAAASVARRETTCRDSHLAPERLFFTQNVKHEGRLLLEIRLLQNPLQIFQ